MTETEPTADRPITPDLDNSGSFAVRLWHARSSLHITQEELAARAGISGGQTTIAHYEAGRREPSLESLRRLVWALGESADYLVATRRGVDEPYRKPESVEVGQRWRHAQARKIGGTARSDWEFIVLEVIGGDGFANMALCGTTSPVAGAPTHDMLTSPEWVFLSAS